MNAIASVLLSTIFIGLGATFTSDLWAMFLKYAFKVAPSNFCLVGRWIRYMPEGIFIHSNIGSMPQKSSECAIGWIAHYTVGIIFAIGFVAFVGSSWLQHPTLLPALLVGIVTVLAPFFVLQPSFGLGIAASKAENPAGARLRTLMNHLAFGVGLYLFGLLARSL